MPSLVGLALQKKWSKCHAILEQRGGGGDVNQRDHVRSALTTRIRQVVTPSPPNLGQPCR
jgi:hypothetical protein